MTINDLDDYAKGEYDCVHGHEALPNQSPSYYEGYGDRYAQEQCDDARSESLYKDTAFGRWLEKMPKNVASNYSEMKVDMGGSRVEVTFYLDDEGF